MPCYKLDTEKWHKMNILTSAHYLFFGDFLSQEINLKFPNGMRYKATLAILAIHIFLIALWVLVIFLPSWMKLLLKTTGDCCMELPPFFRILFIHIYFQLNFYNISSSFPLFNVFVSVSPQQYYGSSSPHVTTLSTLVDNKKKREG